VRWLWDPHQAFNAQKCGSCRRTRQERIAEGELAEKLPDCLETGGSCPSPIPGLSPAAGETIMLIQAFGSQIRQGFEGATSFDLTVFRMAADDLGFDTKGTHEFSDGALFWTRLLTAEAEYFQIIEELRALKRPDTG
jgi:hypothetical protein